ncbi:hypothetical protein LEMLEM_LOCUS27633, partial [Lemmus lemmus]
MLKSGLSFKTSKAHIKTLNIKVCNKCSNLPLYLKIMNVTSHAIENHSGYSRMNQFSAL